MHARPRARRPLARAVFKPPRALGVITGGALAAWAFVLALITLSVAVGAPAEFKTFVAWLLTAALLLLAITFGYWAYSLWTLSYTVERTALAIRWGLRTVLIPIDSIQRMVPGRTLELGRVKGITWWGCHIGQATIPRIGQTLVFSTHSAADEILYLLTGTNTYALTILDQASFAEEIQARAAMGPVVGHAQTSTVRGPASFGFLHDRALLAGIGVGVVLCSVLVGYVFSQYPGMADIVQLHFPALGGVARVGNKSEILRIAYLGAGVLAVNAALAAFAHGRERAAGMWLIASAGMFQAILLAAAVVAISRTT